MYQHAFHGPGDDDYHVYRVYENGRRQKVSRSQDLYLAWIAAGNQPNIVPYVEPEAPAPTPIPAERQAIYADTLALLAEAGITEPPADWPAAIAAAQAYIDEATTVLGLRSRSKVVMTLLAKRLEIDHAGGSWEEGLRYASSLEA